jgi:hypothetical protein
VQALIVKIVVKGSAPFRAGRFVTTIFTAVSS